MSFVERLMSFFGDWKCISNIEPWPDPGGVLGVTAIRISFRLGGLRSVKMANSFWGGGGREGGVRGSRNFRGSSASFKLSTTNDG